MPAVDLACPLCLKDKKIENPIRISQGKIFCNRGHSFDNEPQLMQHKPRKLTVLPRELQPVDPNAEPVTFNVNSKVMAAARERFGPRLEICLTAVMGALCDKNAFVLSTTDLVRISNHLQSEVLSAAQLAGAIFAVVKERDDLRKQVNEIATQSAQGRPVSLDGGITLILPENVLAVIRDKAAFNGETPERVLESIVNMAVSQQWV